MKFKSLKGRNFWSYSEFDVKFDQGLCLIEGHNYDEGGSNGAGKSGLLNSVCFALFGQLPKKIKVDDVINLSNPKDMFLDLVLEVNEVDYRIVRTRKPNNLEFYVSGELISGKDNKETQSLIEKKLGITFETFLCSVYFAQNQNSFLKLSDDEKKSVLTDLLDLSIFDKAHTKAKESFKVLSSDTLMIDTELKSKRQFYTSLDMRVDDYRQKCESYEQIQQTKRDNLNREIALVSADLVTIDQELNLNRSSKEKVKLELDELRLALNQKIQLINELRQGRRELEKSETRVSVEIDSYQKQVDHYNSSANHIKCPTCAQPVSKDVLENEVISLLGFIESKKVERNQIQQQLNEFPTYTDLSTKESEINRSISDKQRILDNNENQINLLLSKQNSYVSKKTDLENQLNSLSINVNPYSELIDQTILERDNTHKTISELQFSLQNKLDELKTFEVLKEVFGNTGIKSYVFDTVVNDMNFRINQYLKKLFDDDVRVYLISETETNSGVIKQKFNVKYHIGQNEVVLSRFSGGEERRIEFAVSLALSDVISNRTSNSFNIVFMDEVFGGLDLVGKEKCMELLQELSQKKDAVFVIDHDSIFQEQFHNILKVEKKNGISKLL